jgi:hypothetical protein
VDMIFFLTISQQFYGFKNLSSVGNSTVLESPRNLCFLDTKPFVEIAIIVDNKGVKEF